LNPILEHPWATLIGVCAALFVVVIVAVVTAVEFAMWRRTAAITAMFREALMHGRSFDGTVAELRQSVRAARSSIAKGIVWQRTHRLEHVRIEERVKKIEKRLFPLLPPGSGAPSSEDERG